VKVKERKKSARKEIKQVKFCKPD